MKKVYVLLAISLLLTLIGKAQDREYSFSEVYDVTEPAVFKINTSDGNINVNPGAKDKIEVFYVVRKNGRLLKISKSELEEDVEIRVVSTPRGVDIDLKYRNNYLNWTNKKTVSFDVLVPSQTKCTINSSDGNITINGLTGDQYAKTSDGNIDIKRVGGSLEAKTSDGNVDVADIGGNVDLITSDGNVVARNVKGYFTGRTSDGNAVIEDVSGPVKMVTSDGRIMAKNVAKLVDLKTSDGGIVLSDASGTIDLKTSDGSINFSDISGSVSAITSDGHIKGNINTLQDKLYMSTNDGSIDIVVPEGLGMDLSIRAKKSTPSYRNLMAHRRTKESTVL